MVQLKDAEAKEKDGNMKSQRVALTNERKEFDKNIALKDEEIIRMKEKFYSQERVLQNYTD